MAGAAVPPVAAALGATAAGLTAPASTTFLFSGFSVEAVPIAVPMATAASRTLMPTTAPWPRLPPGKLARESPRNASSTAHAANTAPAM